MLQFVLAQFLHLSILFVVFAVGEVAAWFVFKKMDRELRPTDAANPPGCPPKVAVVKGVLERLVLYVGLLCGFPTVLIVFGALKVATRLHDESKTPISNDYFLLGNLSSILIVMINVIVSQKLIKQLR